MSHRKTTEEWILEVNEIHNNQYDYQLVDYISAHTNVSIVCKIHGIFSQRANDHRFGKGCNLCANNIRAYKTGNSKRKDINYFIEKARIVHGDLYDYSKSEYISALKKIKIICNIHGEFWQAAHSHLDGYGCEKCSKKKTSIGENLWLDLNNILIENRQYRIIPKMGRKLIVDGYDPITNTCYEYYGDWWHGNPKIYSSSNFHPLIKKSYGEIYSNTIAKENTIKLNGYNLITIWENEFKASLKQD